VGSSQSNEVETGRIVLEAAISLIEQAGSSALRIQEVARLAGVGAPTIYYYFDNRRHLIAAAQAERLRRLLESSDAFRSWTADALEDGDAEELVRSINSYSMPFWSDRAVEQLWDVVEILADVRRDEQVKKEVALVLDQAFLPRIEAVAGLQRAGWVDEEIDPAAWVTLYFGAVFGQVVGDLASAARPRRRARRRMVAFFHRSVLTGPATVRPRARKALRSAG
jgi:AcrR family transcriptional regulator